jgi:hypothetical protein
MIRCPSAGIIRSSSPPIEAIQDFEKGEDDPIVEKWNKAVQGTNENRRLSRGKRRRL